MQVNNNNNNETLQGTCMMTNWIQDKTKVSTLMVHWHFVTMEGI